MISFCPSSYSSLMQSSSPKPLFGRKISTEINEEDMTHLNYKSHKPLKSISRKTEICMIALNTALIAAEATVTGLFLGLLAPITVPLMALSAGLIGKSATNIVRKNKARKRMA